jgi:tetratricopeptide (TPR) repeat protein
LNRGWAPLRGTLDGRLKYIDLPLPELYDLSSDPGETRNLVSHEPQRLEAMKALLANVSQGDLGPRPEEESAEIRERLKALGYVTSASTRTKEHFDADDDPKRLIDLDRALQDVMTHYKAGDLKGALDLSEALVRRRPDMAISSVHLAFLRREAGDLAGAVEAAKRAVSANPEDDESVAFLGVYLNESGRAAEAVRLLTPYSSRSDLDVLTALGMAQAMTGRTKDSLATFEKIRTIDPSNGMALVNIGTVYLMNRDSGAARTAFQRALELDPKLARAQNSLGVIAAQEGRREEAIRLWKEAVRIDPRDYQTLFNLGTALIGLGREAEARPYLDAYLRQAPRALEAREMDRVRAWLGAHPAS